MLVEAGEEEVAAAGHLLCGGGAEHLVNSFGAGLGDGLNLGLGHSDEEQNVAAEQLYGAINDFGAHGGFGEIRDPQNQSAARLEAVQRRCGSQMVGFAGFGADLGEGLDQLAKVCGAATGEQALLDALAIGEQADAVAGKKGQLGQRDGGGAGVVELGVWGGSA